MLHRCTKKIIIISCPRGKLSFLLCYNFLRHYLWTPWAKNIFSPYLIELLPLFGAPATFESSCHFWELLLEPSMWWREPLDTPSEGQRNCYFWQFSLMILVQIHPWPPAYLNDLKSLVPPNLYHWHPPLSMHARTEQALKRILLLFFWNFDVLFRNFKWFFNVIFLSENTTFQFLSRATPSKKPVGVSLPACKLQHRRAARFILVVAVVGFALKLVPLGLICRCGARARANHPTDSILAGNRQAFNSLNWSFRFSRAATRILRTFQNITHLLSIFGQVILSYILPTFGLKILEIGSFHLFASISWGFSCEFSLLRSKRNFMRVLGRVWTRCRSIYK